MTQKKINFFINNNYSKPPKKSYSSNETDVYHIDDIWSLDILDLKNYGPEKNRGHRYVLVNKGNFSKYGWTIPLANKNAETIKDFRKNFDNFKKKTKFNRNRPW